MQLDLGMEKLFEHNTSSPWTVQSASMAQGPKARPWENQTDTNVIECARPVRDLKSMDPPVLASPLASRHSFATRSATRSPHVLHRTPKVPVPTMGRRTRGSAGGLRGRGPAAAEVPTLPR